MKLRTLFIIPMAAPILINTALASLPDEINYEPYKVQYDQLSAEVNVITTNLNQAKEDLQYAYNLEASTMNSIQNLEDQNRRMQTEIEDNEDQRRDLTATSEDLEDQIDQLNKNLNRLERQRNHIEREMIQEERRLAPLQDRVARMEVNLDRQNIAVDNARRTFRQTKRISEGQRAQLNTLKGEKKLLKVSLVKLQDQLATIDSQIATASSQLAGIDAKIAAAVKNLDTQKAKKAKLDAEIKVLQAELAELMRADRANPRVRELRGLVAAKVKESRAQAQSVKQAKTRADRLTKSKTTLSASVTRLQNQKKTLPTQIKRTQTALKTKKELIAVKKIEVGNAEQKTAQRRADVDRLALEANNIQNRLSRARNELVRESSRINQLAIDFEDTQSRVANVSRQLNSTTTEYNQTNEQISSIDRRIPQLQSSIRTNESELKKLDNELEVTQDKIVALNQDVNELSSEQTAAITDRDRKYQEYLSRFNYYGQKLSEAKMLGASQTDVALNIAKTDSNVYVDARSSELGNQIGQEVANAQSEFWASVRSEIKGYHDGYEQGYASTVDQSRGEQEGIKAGIRAAKDYANRVLKPQFFNNIFASRIQSEQLKINKIQESMQKTLERIDAQEKNVMDAFAVVAPISSNEISQSLELNTSLDASITTFKTNLAQVLEQKMTLGIAGNAYQKVAIIPYQTYDCSNVYKNIQVFENACKTSYHKVFGEKYTTEHEENFEAQYNNKYEGVVETKRTLLIEGLYEADLKKFYPIAKDSGVADGKADIYKDTYANAKTAAYNSELPLARAGAQITAGEEVDTWINVNPTLTLKGASVTNTDLQGGSRAKVTVKVKNISPTDLAQPVKVIITGVQNATVTTREFYIKAAKGSSTTDFSSIDFRINPDAASNEKIIVTGKVILSGGKYNTQREETFRAEATTSVNPAVSSTNTFDSSPKVVSNFRRRTLIHNFDVAVSPKIESLRNGYTVQMSATNGYEGMIQMKNTRVTTGSLNLGSLKKVRFQYTFPKSSRGKTVKLNLTYSHKGKKVKSEVIELRPH